MFAATFVKEVKTLSGFDSVGLYERVDKLNTFMTPILLGICVAIVGTSAFYLRPLDCYLPNAPTGSGLQEYIQDYCWVHGTIPVASNQPFTQNPQTWDELDKTSRIVYYQWMPFFLGLMALLFYLPHYFWSAVCHNRVGTDYALIVQLAYGALQEGDEKVVDEKLQTAADGLYDMLVFTRRKRNFEKFYVATGSVCRRVLFYIHHTLFFNKSINRALVVAYFVFKCMLLGISLLELWLLARFLDYDGNFLTLGFSLGHNLVTGKQWQETSWFPRVAYCRTNLSMLGSTNPFTAQCALAINMLNEKFCVFLALWFILLSVVNLLSLTVWTFRFCRRYTRYNFVHKHLLKADNLVCNRNMCKEDNVDTMAPEEKKPLFFPISDKDNEKHLDHFACTFLKQDGVFVLRMVRNNVGTFMCSRLLLKLWTKYMQLKDTDGLPQVNDAGMEFDKDEDYF